MSGKKVQVGRSRMAEEMARPTWEAPSAPVSIHKKKETAPKQPRQKVETISSAPITQRKLRAAAYARVSTDLDSQETSIENQCDHYLHLIESNPDWELAGIYEESGVSGTKADTRPELQRLLKDCEAGAVDVIITKSISRFARNTSECLEMVRKLTGLGIRLIFEKENIDTETMESEFLLTLHLHQPEVGDQETLSGRYLQGRQGSLRIQKNEKRLHYPSCGSCHGTQDFLCAGRGERHCGHRKGAERG